MNILNSTTISLTIIITLLSGCSTAPNSNNQPGSLKKQTVIQTHKATITEVKKVAVADPNSNSRVLRTTGSIAGSFLGAGNIAGSIIGSMIGGTVGGSADKGLSRQPGLEISLQLENGENVIVTQLVSETQTFKSGDKVKLVKHDNYAQVQHL